MKAVIDRFVAADRYLIATPMWNFGVPHRLKQHVDVTAQPCLAFSFSADGVPTGHVTGRPATVIAARRGVYGGDSRLAAMDHQMPRPETMLRFIGIEDISKVLIEPTIGTPEDVATARAVAMAEARALAARRFAA